MPPTRLDRPLAGLVVVDVSRMLPGAVLARALLDLGARVIKVEHPDGGDLLRQVLPQRTLPSGEAIGAGFATFYAGAESVTLDLRTPFGADALSRMARRSDVLVESFRPGTLATWGLDPERLMAANQRLIVCSLPGFETGSPARARLAHDLNIMAESGLLDELRGGDLDGLAGKSARPPLPGAQIADVTCGLLACTGIVSALLERERTGKGAWIEQSLASGVRPFLLWSQVDAAVGGPSFRGEILGGRLPIYHVYRSQDGQLIALGALEPKFWVGFVTALGMGELAPLGLDRGPEGERAIGLIAARISESPASDWVRFGEENGVPISVVRPLPAAMSSHEYDAVTSHALFGIADPVLRHRPAPALGEHTERALAEFS